jgi:hypothetical protein
MENILDSAANGWNARSMQNVEPMFEQRFSIELNVGEHVVIAADDRNAQAISRRFFYDADNEGWRAQRVLVVRLADMSEVTGVASK